MSGQGKFSATWWKQAAIAVLLVTVMPLAIPLVAGAIWGVKAGVIVGAVAWFLFGVLASLDKALVRGSNTRLGKVINLLGFPLFGAFLGWLGAYVFAAPAGAV